MNKKLLTMNFWSIAVFLALLTTTTARILASPISFPRVYTAKLLTPDNDLASQTQFAAEVDLISFKKVNEMISKISFMVHDQEELTRLEILSKSAPTQTHGTIKIDVNATAALHEQINYKGPKSRVGSPYTTITDFPCYKNLLGSFSWMDAMVERAKSIAGLTVTKADIGNSYLKSKNAASGYDIWVLKVTGTAAAGATKGVFFVMSGLHAREYAPPELASRWIEYLINSYGNDPDITGMLDYTEIHLVLQANPDGRAVAETNRAAMRRKNVNPNSGKCSTNTRGVDLNRNFPFRYGLSSGSSSDECSNTYRGKSAASEPEVKAIVDYCASIFPVSQRKSNPVTQQQVAYPENTTMGVFLDIHSKGNLVLRPWSYSSTTLPPNIDGFRAAAEKVKFFTKYTEDLGYLSSGTSQDNAYGNLGAAGFCFELGTSWYQDCPTFENTIYPINLKPLTYLAKISKAPFSIAKGPDVMSISTSVSGNVLTVVATASDSALSKTKLPTSQQKVKEIRVFVNTHPYSLSNSSAAGAVLTSGRATFDVSTLANESRNVVFVQATDSAGSRGPVTATYFFKK